MESLKIEIISWVKLLAAALVFALCINQFVIVNARVPSGSMENTIMTNDRIMGLRLSYLFSGPERGDIVVFQYPDDEKIDYVKRIIGLPGETVEIRAGKVYIDGAAQPLDDSFIKEEAYGDYGPYTVPEDSYFMLGDNRNNSRDSRFWQNKYVKKNKILGKVYFRYYPNFEILR